ncbi:hypothetical protein HMPREF1030_01216, partial [Pseudomonas aeruginosa]
QPLRTCRRYPTSPARISHARSPVHSRFLSFAQYFLRRRGPRRFPDRTTPSLRPGQGRPGQGQQRALHGLAQRPARLPAGTLPGLRRTDPSAEVRQQRGGRALPHRTRRPAADRLAETALAAPAGRPRRLEDLRQLLRSEAELHRTRLPVWPVPAGPRPEGRRLRHQRTPVAGRQVAAGCLRHPVRPLAGRRPAHRGKGLETPQAGRRSAQLQPRLAPRAAPADPRQPGRADGQRGAEPRPR